LTEAAPLPGDRWLCRRFFAVPAASLGAILWCCSPSSAEYRIVRVGELRAGHNPLLRKFTQFVLLGVNRRGAPIEKMEIAGTKIAIYGTPSIKRGRTYPGFTARFATAGRPRRLFRASRVALRKELQVLLGDCAELTLNGPSLREYERAQKLASEGGFEIDEGLLRLKKLGALASGKGTTVEEALEYFARHHDQAKFSTPCPKVVETFLADRKLMGNSSEDIATLRCRLRRFAVAFSCPLRDITKDQYRKYFAATGRSLRDQHNHRSSVARLVNWARNNDYVPNDHPGIPGTGSRVRIPPKRVEVFNREQRELLIAQARPVELPLTLVRAYVPIRSKECGLVSWEDVNWKTRTITVYADKAKKRESRSVNLVPELIARLQPLSKPTGPIYRFKDFYKVGPRLAKKAGIKWLRNGWRCSVISHLQSFVRDLGRVADEAGNSPQQIKRCYLKNLDPESGRAWFGFSESEHHPLEPVQAFVTPSQGRLAHSPQENDLPENVIPLPCVASQT
jgi:integrase